MRHEIELSSINQINGPLANGLANGLEQLTAAIARLSYGLPGANTPVVPAPGVQSRIAPSNVAVADTTTVTAKKPVVSTSDAEATEDTGAPAKNVQNELRNSNTQIATSVAAANGRTTAAVAKARADIEKSVKAASDNLNKFAKDGGAQIKKVVDGVKKAVTGAGANTTKSGTGSAERRTPRLVRPASSGRVTRHRGADDGNRTRVFSLGSRLVRSAGVLRRPQMTTTSGNPSM